MNELTITKEKVLEAAAKCPAAKEVLKTMFPQVFEEKWEDISLEYLNDALFYSGLADGRYHFNLAGVHYSFFVDTRFHGCSVRFQRKVKP